MKTSDSETSQQTSAIENDEWLEVVRRHVGSLSFGLVQITVHDGGVVQIERTERIRFEPPRQLQAGPGTLKGRR